MRAALRPPGVHPARPVGFFDGVGEFGSDMATLASLQAKLASIDLRDALSGARWSIVGLVIAVLFIPAAVTVSLLGLGTWLAARFQTDPGLTILAVGGSALVLGALLGYLGYRGLAASMAIFRRSKEELDRNLAWIKTVVTQSGR